MGEGVGCIGYGDSVGSVYVGYEVRRREVGEGYIGWELGMWIVYYCI